MKKQEFGFIPSFSGGFKTFSVAVSTDRNKSTESRLVVYSQGSRAKVFEYLWLKFLWDELTREEFQLLILSNEFLKSDKKVSFFRAILILPKKVLRKRLLAFEKFLGEKPSSRERYHGYQRLDVEIQWITRSLPKVAKYSGYVRNASAVGSKRPGGSGIDLSPLASSEEQFVDENLINWYSLLTVGNIGLFSGSVVILP